jgi:hypothetical protein
MNTTSSVPFPLTAAETVTHRPVLPFGYRAGTVEIIGLDPSDAGCVIITGAGKTVALNLLSAVAYTQQSEVHPIGVSNTGQPEPMTLERAADIIHHVLNHLRNRLADLTEKSAYAYDGLPIEQQAPHMYVTVENLNDLQLDTPEFEGYDEEERADEYREYLELTLDKIVENAERTRIHLIIAVDSADELSDIIRSNAGYLETSVGTDGQNTAIYRGKHTEAVTVTLWAAPDGAAHVPSHGN